MNDFPKVSKAHFIGIGGAGMSGIAKVMCEMGIDVSGSDIKKSSNTVNLQSLGADVKIGHSRNNIKQVDVVISSTAIPGNNPELLEARKRKLPLWPRAKGLAYIARKKKTIAVCGTHGKTTTTSMIALLLQNLGEEPTFLIGGELNDVGSNAKFGKGKWLIAEADESDGSLIHIEPQVLILTNVEADHLDYFGSYEEIEKLFKRFVSQVPKGGLVIHNGDYGNLRRITAYSDSKKISYGFNDECDYTVKVKTSSKFNLYKNKKSFGQVRLKVFGSHNILNAAAAMATMLELGYGFKESADKIALFSGVKRRFEPIKTFSSSIKVYDDYAHHPTEIEAALKTAREKLKGRLICVFQPHRYTRTMLLKEEFASCFTATDILILTDVYSAGEEPIPGVTGKLIADEVIDSGFKEVAYMPTLRDIVDFLKETLSKGDNLITMGAGDVWQVSKQISEIPIT